MQRDFKIFPNATDPAENKILKNWSQNSGTKKMSLFLIFYFNSYVFNSGRVVLQKRQVTATSLGCHCRHSGYIESYILNPTKHLRWSTLQKQSTAGSH